MSQIQDMWTTSTSKLSPANNKQTNSKEMQSIYYSNLQVEYNKQNSL